MSGLAAVLPALVALVAAGAVLLAVDRVALSFVRPPRRPPGRTPGDLSLRHEEVVIPSEYPLRGWYLEPREDAGGPAVVLAHGWAANGGVLLDLAAALVRAGRPVLLFDVRGHGRSAKAPFVTVRHYRDDAVAAAAWMSRRHPGRPLALGGHSMGGAAAVLAVAEGVEAAGLVLVATPADVLEVTAAYMSDRGLGALAAPAVRLFRPFWRLRIREPYRDLVPWTRLGGLDVPVLVVQPEHDRRVSREHAERLARAAGTEPRVVEGADHTDVLGRPETAELVERFLARLPAPERAAGA